MSVKMTAAEVKEAVRRRHGCFGSSGEWVCIEEAFSGWSSMGGGIDVFAIGVWRTAKANGMHRPRRVSPPGVPSPDDP
jgi:hypothetical protein